MAGGVWAVRSVVPQTRPTGRASVWEGFRMLRRDSSLAPVLAVGAAVSLAMDPLITTGAEFATEEFGRPDTLVGVLIAVYGAGAIAAAFTRKWRGTASYQRLGRSVSLIVVGMLVFALSPTLVIALPALFLAGFGHLSSTAASTATVQLSVPDEMRGRILAVWTLSFLGMRPLGSLVDGTVASLAGVRVAAVTMLVPAIVVTAVLLARHRRDASARTVNP
jgi:sugar phosphate permease